jgi:[ribosomal protein S5]-alanine N-acetyltransferase
MYLFETARLRFDYVTLDDAAFALELLNEPVYIQNIADKGVRDIAGAEAYLRDGAIASYAKHGHGLYKVTLKETGEPIGMCGLIRREILEDPDLGYAYLQRHHGNGYASEAGAAVLEHGRRQMHIGRIVAITTPQNTGSIRVLEKLGFHYDSERILFEDKVSSYFICDPS